MLCHGNAHRHLLSPAQQRLTAVALSQLGVREAGDNKGKAVVQYLAYTNLPAGNPWCAAFLSWVHGQCGHAQPRTAWSPSLFPVAKRVNQPQPADVLGIYFAGLGRIAHCGLVVWVKNDWVNSVEGNTNQAGSREGDGVYRKRRHLKTIRYFSRWWQKGGKK